MEGMYLPEQMPIGRRVSVITADDGNWNAWILSNQTDHGLILKDLTADVFTFFPYTQIIRVFWSTEDQP